MSHSAKIAVFMSLQLRKALELKPSGGMGGRATPGDAHWRTDTTRDQNC